MRLLHLSRLFMSFILPIGISLGTFFLQLRLGYDVALFPLYMISVAAFSYSMGFAGALFSVLFSSGLWYLGIIITDYHYDYAWAVYYNTGVRFVLFATTAFFILLFKRVVEQHRQRMEAMRALLNVCHGCGSLQGSDGQWVPFEQLAVSKNRPICECPRCTAAASVQTLKI